jgi:tungstate transport system substrate-binding protein
MRRPWTWLVAVAVLGALACRTEPARPLRLATTTSVEQTGLLADLLPVFEAKAGVKVQVLAVGTGQALKLAERGDVDAVLVHDPEAEEKFVADGRGVDRRALMHNDFVLVGPPDDPAGVRGGRDAVVALQAVAAKGALFVSRGDQSGTHRAELRLWKTAGLTPTTPWYVEAGQGQAQTLIVASERKGYCLTDRATYRTVLARVALELLVEGDPRLVNRYSGMAVNPARQPSVNHAAARAFLDWLVSPEAQARIGAFQKDGQALFVPDALPATGAPKP